MHPAVSMFGWWCVAGIYSPSVKGDKRVPKAIPATQKAGWAADGSQMSAAPLHHVLLLGSSTPVRIMNSGSSCHLTNHCCRLFSLNLACWAPWKLLCFCRKGREHRHSTQSCLYPVSLQVLCHSPTEILLQALDRGWESYQLYLQSCVMCSKIPVWASCRSFSRPGAQSVGSAVGVCSPHCAPGARTSWEQHRAAGWHTHCPERETVTFLPLELFN